jgi:hypothetical protein
VSIRKPGQPTPGPWVMFDRGIGWEVHGPDGWPVNFGHRETFTEADARIVAAAPELWAALEMIHDLTMSQFHKPQDLANAAIKIAGDALAKAGGVPAYEITPVGRAYLEGK